MTAPMRSAPTSQPSLTPIQFNNFTPGIADNPGINYPAEQATRAYTYRCRANASGALIPAPRHVPSVSRDGDLFEAANPSASLGYICSGIYVVSPILPLSGTAGGYAGELWIATEWGLTTPAKKRRLQRVMFDQSPVTTEDIITQSSAVATDAASWWQCWFAQTRSNKAAPTSPGIPVLIIGWGSSVAGFGNLWEFPDDSTPTLSTPYVILAESCIPIVHQNRVVIHKPTTYNHGVNTAYATGENLQWTAANDMTAANLSIVQAFYPEAADGYTVKASMTANELFLLKESGAVAIYGDLDNPTVVNFPMVVGNAEFFGCNGVRTPIGLLYPARGLWAWSGGDSSKKVSPLMRDDFYKPPQSFGGQPGAFWYGINNLIFLSNNFFYDTELKSFWQIDDPSVITFAYSTGARNLVFCARNFYTQTDAKLVRGYNLNEGAVTYSWQSHPIWQSIDRAIVVRQVELIAQGQGTITVTCIGYNGVERSDTIDLANTGFPERFRLDFYVQGLYLQVRLTVASGSASIDAPTIHSLTLHIDERARVRQSA